MQQERERGRREEDQQDRRMNKQAADQQNQNNQQQQQQQQPQQKCPRCDSYNTKFCYYNNYSLSQPRYFCKTCKRYWTQGGTLRNVPVGGGCRKGKRTKTSSSSGETSRSSQAPPLLPSPSAVQQQQPSPVGQINPYYQGGGGAGGFLSSLAAIQSLNQPINNHQLGGGNYIRGPSNMALLQGFTIPNLGSHQPQPHHHHQQQQQQQSQFFQMGINGDKNMEIHQPSPLYQSSQQQSLIQPSSTLNQNWQQHGSFINNTPNNIPSNPTPSDSGLWNIGGATATTTTTAGSSLSPNQWHDHQLAGYGPPPQ